MMFHIECEDLQSGLSRPCVDSIAVAETGVYGVYRDIETPFRVLRGTSNVEDATAWAPHGSGGVWRRRQIDEILRRNGVEPVNIERAAPRSLMRKLIDAGYVLTELPGKIVFSRESLASAGYLRALYRHNARRAGLARVAILDWGTDPVAISTLKEFGFRVVMALMGLGSLWRERPSQVAGPYPKGLITEIESLRLADAVFCISREEQWLLLNLGVRADYLPYFPDRERELFLLAERNARPAAISTRKSEFLICATRGNSDSEASFREQVDWIFQAYPEDSPTFHVVGNQTEAVREIWSGPRFVFHGTCSDEAFVQIRARCRAICVHQQKGHGAATRVPDMILAGLAVIANGPAARSFFDMGGVCVYDTPGQFRELLQANVPMPPLPRRPAELEDAFFASLLLS